MPAHHHLSRVLIAISSKWDRCQPSPPSKRTDLAGRYQIGAFIISAREMSRPTTPRRSRNIFVLANHDSQPIVTIATELRGPPEFENNTMLMQKATPTKARARSILENTKLIYRGKKLAPRVPNKSGCRKLPTHLGLPSLRRS